MKRIRKVIVRSAIGVIALVLLTLATKAAWTISAADAPAPAAAVKTEPAVAAVKAPAGAATELPGDSAFRPAAESDKLKLLADSATGHFQVVDKRTGEIWRSYPDPNYWQADTISGAWRSHLRSPIMLEYSDPSNFRFQPKLVDWIEDRGTIENFRIIQGGFSVTFHFGGTNFRIPVEVKVEDDYVQTRIIDSGIEEGKLSLLNMKLYPMFGAEPSVGQDGYMLIPDGSGALIRFKPNRINDKSIYQESVYGDDISFYSEENARQPVKMPVYGMKSGDKAFLAVMTSGAEYAKLFSSPAGAYGQSNWATAEWQYRIKFFQNTSKKGDKGFFTYSKERFAADRSTRYYLLEKEQSDYVGMAAKYREYLVREQGLQRLQAADNRLPVYVDIVGADVKKGFLKDQYLIGTTTLQAMEMVNRLYNLGIEHMVIQYLGWQTGGYSSMGGLFPVDERLGGNWGMKQFIGFAHSLNVPVYLGAGYTFNNNRRDGFNPRYDGMRNLAGQLMEYNMFGNNEKVSFMSTRFAARTITEDLRQYKELGADGIYFENGIGAHLNSDFNTEYASTRTEAMHVQQDILRQVKSTLGGVSVEQANLYGLPSVGHIHRIADDYSYDLFVDEPVPFVQIALHGLVTYSANWSNERNQYKKELLRGIEYGASPSFILMQAPSGAMSGAYSVWHYSLSVKDWESTAAEEYQRYNKALGDVQTQYITGHRTLAPNVKETTFENGKSVVVNYNETPYDDKGRDIFVPAQDFIVLQGGEGP